MLYSHLFTICNVLTFRFLLKKIWCFMDGGVSLRPQITNPVCPLSNEMVGERPMWRTRWTNRPDFDFVSPRQIRRVAAGSRLTNQTISNLSDCDLQSENVFAFVQFARSPSPVRRNEKSQFSFFRTWPRWRKRLQKCFLSAGTIWKIKKKRRQRAEANGVAATPVWDKHPPQM